MAPKTTGKKGAKIAPPPTSCTAAADRLDEAGVLLHGLHSRHKNQHRVSTYWWPAFGQLRRHVRRLEAELRSLEGREEEERRAVAHAEDLRAQFVPKAYLAFSRLVADRQFAPLGLLLLGVLAQVHTALRQVIGEAATATKDSVADGDKKGGDVAADDGSAHGIANSDSNNADVGVAVAREEERGEPAISGKQAAAENTAPTKKRPRQDDDDSDKGAVALKSAAETAKTDSKAGEGSTGKEMPETKEKTEKKEREGKEKKAKKRKRHRDEFDELFSGLL